MADERQEVNRVINVRQVERFPGITSSPQKLRDFLSIRNEPVIFDGAVSSWECLKWTPEFLAAELGDLRTRFRLCVRESAFQNTSVCNAAVMETDCEYEEATFGEFSEWLNGRVETSGRLSRFERDKYWCYADYKHMTELLKDFPHLRQSVDWTCCGFPGRSGDNSTIWIGSAEASTPCHVDTYGCNLVAQIYGTKKWTLFPPSETQHLHPTRIPYEESSVFSQVNISRPDLEEFTDFANAVRYEVAVKPSDVLFVPKGWWHFVESLQTSISINTWLELESDHLERVKEAIIRTLVCALKRGEGADERTWVNPSEDIGTHMQNMAYLQQALTVVTQRLSSRGGASEANSIVDRTSSLGSLQCRTDDKRDRRDTDSITLSTDEFINCITSSKVITAITSELFKKLGVSRVTESNSLDCIDACGSDSQEHRQTSELPHTHSNVSTGGCGINVSGICSEQQGSGCTTTRLEDSTNFATHLSEEVSHHGSSDYLRERHPPCKRRCTASSMAH